MERKYAYYEIVEALENCSDGSGTGIIKATIDLLKCQNAEIERLNGICADLSKEIESFSDIGKMYSEIKYEAIKEFAERLKEGYAPSGDFGDPLVLTVTAKWIDNLVKEMTEEQK